MSSYWNYRECYNNETVMGGTPDDDEPTDTDLAEALTWWNSDECSRLPTVVHAKDYVLKRWGDRVLARMIDVFVTRMQRSPRQAETDGTVMS